MERYDNAFAQLKARKEGAFVPSSPLAILARNSH
jgi:tryptophan synthase alpha subunit